MPDIKFSRKVDFVSGLPAFYLILTNNYPALMEMKISGLKPISSVKEEVNKEDENFVDVSFFFKFWLSLSRKNFKTVVILYA